MNLDRSRPPVADAVRPFHFPAWRGHRLANGMRLMVLPQSDVPLAQFEVLMDVGADTDPLDRSGLTALGSGLLDEGTSERDSIAIADQVERLGASLFTTGDWDGTYVGASSLSSHVDELFDLVAEVVRRPTFPPAEIERQRAMRLASLANRLRQPGFAAARRALDLVYGAKHPYGRSLAGTPSGFEAITPADLEAWHRLRAHPDRATLVAVGDVELDRLAVLAERHFGDWRPADSGANAPGFTVPPPPRPAAGRRIALVDRPEAAQTELRLLRVGPPRAAPGYLAARLVNLIFGGKFSSRLNLNLREEKGITYSVHSRLAGRRGPGPFTIACAVDNDAAGVAVGEILRELDRLATEPPTQAEVDDAKNYLLGTFPYRVQSLEGLADHLAELALHGLPDDYYATLPEAVTAVSLEEICGAAATLLDSSDLVVAAAGPADSLRSRLADFGRLEDAAEEPV